jgi:hypothetical protein
VSTAIVPTLFGVVLALLLPGVHAAAQEPAGEERTGRYHVTMEGHPISLELYTADAHRVRLCADYAGAGALVRAELEAEGPGRPVRYAATYDLAYPVDGGWQAERRRYGLRVDGDTLRWEAEEGGLWRERAVAWDPERPLVVFQSALFALFAQFARIYGDRDGPLEIQGLVMEEAALEEWTVEREGDAIRVDSPQGISSLLYGTRGGAPERVEIPGQEVEAWPEAVPGVVYPPLCSPPESVSMPSEGDRTAH